MNSVATAKSCSHARAYHYVEGEGYCEKPEPTNGCPVHTGGETPEIERAFRFCRMFTKGTKTPSDAALIALGQAMEDPGNTPAGDSQLSGGFTYLGQFIDHDMTADKTEGLPTGSLDPAEIESGRSPSLDLDSVYGRGPDESPELYETDKLHLKIGHTTGRPDFGVTDSFPNDLPRDPVTREAIIGDHRNDENLAVAQIHLAFLKFHNKVADQVMAAGAADPFMKTRKIVTQHYQSIVLHHFVPWLADEDVREDVRKNGRTFWMPNGIPEDKSLCMPIEFSVGAYRFGHSLVRNEYEWNRVFNSSGIPASLALLFEFSKLSGNLGGSQTLPSDWIVDWTRLFDFSDIPGVSNHPESNKTRLIDTQLALKLGDLPEFQGDPEPHKKALAVRNLLRGRLVGLPTGQEVAAKMGVTPLTPEELAAGPHGTILRANNLHCETPLFYYILREAKVQQGGQRLGQVGSRILVETFHGLIEGSQFSILQENNWKPSLHPRNAMFYTMGDMLAFVGDLNPIG